MYFEVEIYLFQNTTKLITQASLKMSHCLEIALSHQINTLSEFHYPALYIQDVPSIYADLTAI